MVIRRRVAALAGLTLIAVAFHATALSGWWLSDDPQVLIQAVRQSPRDYFFVPEAWRYLSSSNFTPLVTLSFEGDLHAAGLEPRAFYFHQIVVLALAAALLYLYLAPFAGDIPAFAGAALFLVSPQAIVAARTLMVRHYVEGLALTLLALIFWRLGRKDMLFTLVAALAYLGAMLAKEIYAPIPLFMLYESFVAKENWKRIAVRTSLIAVVAAGYVVWRIQMLASFGGYVVGQPLQPFGRSLWANMLGGAPVNVAIPAAVAIIALTVLALMRQIYAVAPFLLTALIVILLPLLPVSGQLDVRHGFFAFAVVCAAVALALNLAGVQNFFAAVAMGLLLLTTIVAGQIVQRRHQETSARMVAEGKYVWTGKPQSPVLLADSPGWYTGGLAKLRAWSGRGEGPRVLLSDDALVVEPIDLRRVVSARESSISRLSRDRVAAIEADRSSHDPALPLSVKLDRKGTVVTWLFGPEPTFGWTFLTYPQYDEYSVPHTGTRVIPDPADRQYFRVRRRVVDGRWNVSPPLELPPPGRSVAWQN